MCKNPPSTLYRYLDLPSTQSIQTHNTHRHNTTPPSQTQTQASTHSPSTPPTPTPPQPKHRHISKFPHVPPELVKPRPNSVTHSPPTPPTPPRAKHIHMSHTPPTPLTTLISCTSPALDKTHEPRVVVCHDQVRLQVSQGFRCRDSKTHELIPQEYAIDPLVTSQSGVWCKRTDVSHLVVKLRNLYRCRLVLLTPYACNPAIDGSVLIVVVKEYIVVFG